jgi:hypothetical protein
MSTNRISAEITAADFQEVIKSLDNASSKMSFLITASAKEKKAKQLMGAGSVSYVQSGVEASKSHTDILARNFSIEEYEKDQKLINDLRAIGNKVFPLAEKLRDTMAILGQELMDQTNEVYAAVKREAKKNGNLKGIAEEMGKRYEVSKNEGDTSTENTPSK